jgi:hypothetical protein
MVVALRLIISAEEIRLIEVRHERLSDTPSASDVKKQD